MTIFLISLLVIFIYLGKRNNCKALTDPIYWLAFFWILIFGVYFTSGIEYIYGFSFYFICFFTACVIFFVYGYRKGLYKKSKVLMPKKRISIYQGYVVAGIIGVVLFSYDYIRLNGIAETKGDTNISIIGSIANLFIPILLVMGLYLNAQSIKKHGSFNILGIVLIFAYSIPCMLNAGREAILFSIIGFVCLYGYKKIIDARTGRQNIGKNYLLLILGISAVIYMGFLIVQISKNRFTDNEINILLAKRDVSYKSMDEASSWGDFSFLYYNTASYFSHQIPFLDFTLRNYDGPYLLGMYELNIVSRRLPDSLGLDYQLAFEKLNKLYLTKEESFSYEWNTVLGSLIIDFTWVGAILACGLCGYAICNIKKKFYRTLDPRYATLIALLCLSAFSTIQLGPFFHTTIYGTYIWWYIIFRKDKRITLKRYHKYYDSINKYT